MESIPGMLILCVISFLGLTAKHFIPSSLPAVTYIGIIGMLAAVPASPVSAPIIYWTGKIDLMASISPHSGLCRRAVRQGLESIPVHWLEGRSGVAASDLRDFLYIRADSAVHGSRDSLTHTGRRSMPLSPLKETDDRQLNQKENQQDHTVSVNRKGHKADTVFFGIR